MKRIILSAITIASLSFGSQAQNVNFLDGNFKAYLVGNAAINTNLDTEIQVSEANAFTGEINCSSLGIANMTGIEEFINLDQLQCQGNLISTIDLSQNTSLTVLACHSNLLASLDVSNNTLLTYLKCDQNNLVSLDVSQNTALTDLWCGFNDLTGLDVSQNVALTELYCFYNSITSLDVSNNTSLTLLNCEGNSITALNVSSNTALIEFACSENSLTSLDLSSNASLVDLYCYDNLLTSLNLANGNNGIIATVSATGNPNLTCIQVDDAAYSTTNWTSIDVTASFSEDCNGGIGINELNAFIVNIYPNPTSSQITVDSEELIEGITIFNMFGELVQQETSATFSVENLSNGVYVMNIQTSKGIARSRFIKE